MKVHKVHNEGGFTHPALLILTVVAISVISFAGFRVYQANVSKPQLNHERMTAKEKLLPAELESILAFDKVKELATRNTEASITGLELKNEDGTLVYKVVLSDGTVKILDAHTGEVVADASDDNESAETNKRDGEDALPANFTVNISFDKAREIAQATFPNSKVSKIQLDVEEGVVVLSVRFADKARVDVNAATGSIVRTKAPRVERDKKVERNDADDSSSSGSSRSGSSGSGSSGSGSNNEIRIEGTLVNNNGTYTVTSNGVTYTIQGGEDMNQLTGTTVRVEGILKSGNVIQAEKVDER